MLTYSWQSRVTAFVDLAYEGGDGMPTMRAACSVLPALRWRGSAELSEFSAEQNCRSV